MTVSVFSLNQELEINMIQQNQNFLEMMVQEIFVLFIKTLMTCNSQTVKLPTLKCTIQ